FRVDGDREPAGAGERREVRAERRHEIAGGRAVGDGAGDRRRAGPLAQRGEEPHGHRHGESRPTMWPSWGAMSRSTPSSTALLDPGSANTTVCPMTPPIARVSIAAAPIC